ncbi:unnamed protein product [Alopecurus aequalis]
MASSSSPPPIPPRASSSSPPTTWDAISDEVWGHAFSFLPADADRGAAAAVCGRWFHAERVSRSRVTVRNCYATTPTSVVGRFPSVRAAEVKGMPHWADFDGLPANWGAYAEPGSRPPPKPKPGRTSRSSASSGWSCHNLKTLKLHDAIPVDTVASILRSAPQLTQLGTGNLSNDYQPDIFANLVAAFAGCRSMRSISGAWGKDSPAYLPALYSVCEGLTSLNLCSATVRGPGLLEFIRKCKNLVHLWVMDLIEDDGMSVVASTCIKLQEPIQFFDVVYEGPPPILTERGLVDVSASCPMLQTILFFCSQMTNEALITVARNLPNLTSFRFAHIMPSRAVDYISRQPFDEGFSAIVQSCRGLRRLSISGRLTDAGLRAIGIHASRLEVLSLAKIGNGATDVGLDCILSGCCTRLRRLQAMNCNFGDIALPANAAKLETMRYVWLFECKVTVLACRQLALTMPRLTVEMIGESEPAGSLPPHHNVDALYVYRTLAGTRQDAPPESVQICSVI